MLDEVRRLALFTSGIAELTRNRAEKIVKDAFDGLKLLKAGKGRSFYAVGGTWRALGHLHMAQTGYPLHVMHGYVIRARRSSSPSLR